MSKNNELTPHDIEYYDEMTVPEINDFIQALIQDLQFEAVPIAQKAIKNKQQNAEIEAKETIENNFKTECVEAKDLYEIQLNDLEKQYKAKEIQIREKIDEAFKKMKEMHIEQLVEIEKKFAAAIIKSQEKPVKEQLEIEEQARRIARDGDIESAIKYRKMAEETKVKVLDQRRDAIEAMYNEKRLQARQRQQKELQILQEKLIKKLKALETSKKEDLVEREKALNVSVRAAEQKRANKLQSIVKPHD
ncbi:hypothetical protein TVAG_359140 [Trichomonas vaginalis G3]|uniref:Uncharacterized protein n=1 Tax=Trichomonas vaginalis (strain ATCC PRA-98 / G3) TaxID=412133 RepID=A2E8B6_TRIV3|nr:hypothetical protein TVAGG3_1026880 [Trichomonas vaginalis G3]EAY11134.1 hypothetical protein TVAG_359140 [Trichomonas vaginalis G3]KAI5492565.1 hypothetical protein TVAGG3_1026880 [Trichomonas vaginalis G3]|eukprot:XP_001323357.1 hypothetical protein [Trichomonas vaginalis G3]